MQRLIILGASNVTRSFGRLVSIAGEMWHSPLEVFAAHGHGRSYGAAWSTVFVRKLPGILHCGLWNAVRSAVPESTSAVVTDIGNDILYEFPVERIAGWIERCFDQLQSTCGQIVVTALPVQNLETLSPARYKFFRKLLMPGCSLSLKEAAERAQALNERVVTMAQARGIHVVASRREWYGLDPIHVRRSASSLAWHSLLEPLRPQLENLQFTREKRLEMLMLRWRRPAHAQWFGRNVHRPQPSARWSNGTTIWMY